MLLLLFYFSLKYRHKGEGVRVGICSDDDFTRGRYVVALEIMNSITRDALMFCEHRLKLCAPICLKLLICSHRGTSTRGVAVTLITRAEGTGRRRGTGTADVEPTRGTKRRECRATDICYRFSHTFHHTNSGCSFMNGLTTSSIARFAPSSEEKYTSWAL